VASSLPFVSLLVSGHGRATGACQLYVRTRDTNAATDIRVSDRVMQRSLLADRARVAQVLSDPTMSRGVRTM
jgi:hypothetical protein